LSSGLVVARWSPAQRGPVTVTAHQLLHRLHERGFRGYWNSDQRGGEAAMDAAEVVFNGIDGLTET